MCGHATIAAVSVLKENTSNAKTAIETQSGPIEVKSNEGIHSIVFTKGTVDTKIYESSEVAPLLGIDREELGSTPIVSASVAVPKLMIPVKSLESIQKMQPNFTRITEFSVKNKINGLYPFTTETIHPEADFHARQFNPAAGIDEDPVTGVAAGALMLYTEKFDLVSKDTIVIEQGYEMGMPGKIYVSLEEEKVYVGGNAVPFSDNTYD